MKTLQSFTMYERWILPVLIAILTLADGILHLRLDYLLFNGKLWGSAAPGGGGPPPGPPPGAPAGASGPPPGHGGGSPFPLPLNEMFFLNFLGAIGLVLVFWLAWRWLPRWLWIVDLGVITYAAVSIWGWWDVGKPNPQGLGHQSKAIEIVLILLVAAHAWLMLRLRGGRGPATAMLSHGHLVP